MKELVAGILFVLIIGLGGFIYRNVLEHSPRPGPVVTACTQEAKLCPDGSSVGRTGPSCSFAPCQPPNVEIPEVGITFALPPGYAQFEQGTPDQETLRIYQKSLNASSSPHVIDVKHYQIPAGKTANDVMLAESIHDPSGLPAKSMTEFTIATLNGKTFYGVLIGRFEGQVETSYYLPRQNDVLRFDVIECNVANWTDPKLDVGALPEHQALLKMLSTLELTGG